MPNYACRQHHHLGGEDAAGPSVSPVKTRLQQCGGEGIRIPRVGRLLLHHWLWQDGERQRQAAPRGWGPAPPPLPPIVKTVGSVLRKCSNRICLWPMYQTGFVQHPPTSTGIHTWAKNSHLRFVKIKNISQEFRKGNQ